MRLDDGHLNKRHLHRRTVPICALTDGVEEKSLQRTQRHVARLMHTQYPMQRRPNGWWGHRSTHPATGVWLHKWFARKPKPSIASSYLSTAVVQWSQRLSARNSVARLPAVQANLPTFRSLVGTDMPRVPGIMHYPPAPHSPTNWRPESEKPTSFCSWPPPDFHTANSKKFPHSTPDDMKLEGAENHAWAYPPRNRDLLQVRRITSTFQQKNHRCAPAVNHPLKKCTRSLSSSYSLESAHFTSWEPISGLQVWYDPPKDPSRT